MGHPATCFPSAESSQHAYPEGPSLRANTSPPLQRYLSARVGCNAALCRVNLPIFTFRRPFLVAVRAEAEDDRYHDAAARKDGEVIGTIDRRGPVGHERIGVAVGGAVDCLGKRSGVRRSGDGVAVDGVLVEEIVEAEAELGLIEHAATANGVVEEEVGNAEGVDRSLVVI